MFGEEICFCLDPAVLSSERRQVLAALKSVQARFEFALTQSVTHHVCPESAAATGGNSTTKRAVEVVGALLVSPAFVLDCVASGTVLPVENYVLSLGQPRSFFDDYALPSDSESTTSTSSYNSPRLFDDENAVTETWTKTVVRADSVNSVTSTELSFTEEMFGPSSFSTAPRVVQDSTSSLCVQYLNQLHSQISERISNNTTMTETSETQSFVALCGRNSHGQLGSHDTEDRTNSTKPPRSASLRGVDGLARDHLVGVTDVALGTRHSLFLTRDGQVWACGSGTELAVGVPDSYDRRAVYEPEQVIFLPPKDELEYNKRKAKKQIKPADSETPALELYSSSLYADSMLSSSALVEHQPVETSGNDNTKRDVQFRIVSISAGHNLSACIDSDGDVWAWGQKLGDVPQLLHKVQHTTAIGRCHSVACGGDRIVVLGERNVEFKLAARQSGRIFHVIPIILHKSKADAVKICCGMSHALLLDTTGAIWAWGKNGSGQLGVGDRNNRQHPVRVQLPEGQCAIHIAAGGDMSACMSGAGDVLVWGSNFGMRLGVSTYKSISLRSGNGESDSDDAASSVAASTSEKTGQENTIDKVAPRGTSAQRDVLMPMQLAVPPAPQALKAVTNAAHVPGKDWPRSFEDVVASQLSLGISHGICQFGKNGAVITWGQNQNGQRLCDASTTPEVSFVSEEHMQAFRGGAVFERIVCGGHHTAVLVDDIVDILCLACNANNWDAFDRWLTSYEQNLQQRHDFESEILQLYRLAGFCVLHEDRLRYLLRALDTAFLVLARGESVRNFREEDRILARCAVAGNIAGFEVLMQAGWVGSMLLREASSTTKAAVALHPSALDVTDGSANDDQAEEEQIPTVLYAAVSGGKLAFVEHLLRRGMPGWKSMPARSLTHRTALASCGHQPQRLVTRGVDANAVAKLGKQVPNLSADELGSFVVLDDPELMFRGAKNLKQADTACVFSISPDRFVCSYGGDTPVLFDIHAREQPRELRGHTDKVLHLDCLWDSTIVATASADTTTKLWHPTTSACFATLSAHAAAVNHCCFSPPSRVRPLLATASADGTCAIWDVDSATEVARLREPEQKRTGKTRQPNQQANEAASRVLWCCFSADGSHIAATTTSRRVFLATLDERGQLTNDEPTLLFGHKAWVRKCWFVHDRADHAPSLLLSYSDDNVAFVWDVSQRTKLHRIEMKPDDVNGALGSESRFLCGGKLWKLNLPLGPPPKPELQMESQHTTKASKRTTKKKSTPQPPAATTPQQKLSICCEDVSLLWPKDAVKCSVATEELVAVATSSQVHVWRATLHKTASDKSIRGGVWSVFPPQGEQIAPTTVLDVPLNEAKQEKVVNLTVATVPTSGIALVGVVTNLGRTIAFNLEANKQEGETLCSRSPKAARRGRSRSTSPGCLLVRRRSRSPSWGRAVARDRCNETESQQRQQDADSTAQQQQSHEHSTLHVARETNELWSPSASLFVDDFAAPETGRRVGFSSDQDAARSQKVQPSKPQLTGRRKTSARGDWTWRLNLNQMTQGETALHRSIRDNHLEIAELLVGAGASLRTADSVGRHALELLQDANTKRNLRWLSVQRKVFISYTHCDIKRVSEIRDDLEQRFICCWMDDKSLEAGSDWRQNIGTGVNNCRVVLFVATHASVKSLWCLKELVLAAQYGKERAVLFLDDVVLPDRFAALVSPQMQFSGASSVVGGLQRLFPVLCNICSQDPMPCAVDSNGERSAAVLPQGKYVIVLHDLAQTPTATEIRSVLSAAGIVCCAEGCYIPGHPNNSNLGLVLNAAAVVFVFAPDCTQEMPLLLSAATEGLPIITVAFDCFMTATKQNQTDINGTRENFAAWAAACRKLESAAPAHRASAGLASVCTRILWHTQNTHLAATNLIALCSQYLAIEDLKQAAEDKREKIFAL